MTGSYFNIRQPGLAGNIEVKRHQTEQHPDLMAVIYLSDTLNMHVRSAEDARQLLAAAWQALQILDPGSADDAAFALLTAPGLEKIQKRIAAKAAPADRCCGAEAPGEDVFGCTEPPGHAGDHVARGIDGDVYHTWPQPACARCGTTICPLNAEQVCWNHASCVARQHAKAVV